jgi:hypothetical protein
MANPFEDFIGIHETIDPGSKWGFNPPWDWLKEQYGEDKGGLPPVGEFEYDEFEYPEFQEDFGFEERKTEPLDLSGIFRQARQRQAITGVEPSAAFISGIAEPALKEKTKESIMFTELENRRRREEREQAFREYGIGREQEFREFASERDIAFQEFVLGEERKIEEEKLRIMEEQGGGSDACPLKFVTACYGKKSEEVNMAREYKDTFLDEDTKRGYYMLAEQLVPVMKKDESYKQYVKENLVDHLIKVGKHRLDKTDIQPTKESINITDGFLNFCNIMGKSVESFTRSNGEVL